MEDRHDRRRFLAAVGASSLALAGCVGFDPSSNGRDGAGSDGDDGDGGERGAGGNEVVPPALDHGELLDDFEEIDVWTPIDGDATADEETTLTGGQSLRMENRGTTAGVFQAFPDGLDVEESHLSMAVRVETPRPARVALEIDAPGRSDRLQAVRTVLGPHEGWLRMDAGWTATRGEPNLANVQEMRIYVSTPEERDIRFWIDDLRATPKGDQGYVILSFDDGVESQYTTALPILERYGYRAAAAVIPNALNRPGRLQIDQLREMRDAGWDVSSHPDAGDGLAALEPEEARETIRFAREYLEDRGFPNGARHVFAPYHSIDQEAIDIAREYHETCFYFAGGPSNVPTTDAMHLSRVDMHDFEGFTRLVDAAAEHNQLAVGLAHGVQSADAEEDDPHADITDERLVELLDYIAESDVEVITPSQLIDDL